MPLLHFIAILFFLPALIAIAPWPADAASAVPLLNEQPIEEEEPALERELTRLIREEVDQALKDQPKPAATQEGAPHYSAIRIIDEWFFSGLDHIDFLRNRLTTQLQGVMRLPEAFSEINARLRKNGPAGYPLQLMLRLAAVIGGALLMEFAVRILLRPFMGMWLGQAPATPASRAGQFASIAAAEAVAITVYAYGCLWLFYLLIPLEGPARVVTYKLLWTTFIIHFVQFAATLLLMPGHRQLRFIPLADQSARFLHHWLIAGSIPIVFFSSLGMIVNRLKLDESIFLGLIGMVIASTLLVFVAMILVTRTMVRTAIEQNEQAVSGDRSLLMLRAARFWHIGAILLVTILMVVWEIRLLSTGKIYFGKILLSSLVLIFIFAVDYWGQRLFQLAFTQRTPGAPETPEDLAEEASAPSSAGQGWMSSQTLSGYSMRLRTAYRILLLAFAIFLLLSFWEVNLAIGRIFTLSALLVLTILILAYLAWSLFRFWIDARITDELPDQEEFDEGGRGGSRRGTLLLLLRKAVLALLLALTIMALMAALGINIIPLIAGAGIIGLAISFGAQSLIADIFAGIFFLIDDAFRVGDYVDCNGTVGTVEHISLRSLRLRHHRGMVHTIPFGKIGSVTNYSRDYIIMKLDFRVRYDTDVDKVRKIVKRIYQELQQDPEYGPKLIGKLKSQGVREMDDSAMIMRVKFTTRPGDQFILRKEVYRRIQEGFQANNIQFAHRNVTVYVPPEEQGTADPPAQAERTRRQGAAAAAAVLQEEDERHSGPQPADDEP